MLPDANKKLIQESALKNYKLLKELIHDLQMKNLKQTNEILMSIKEIDKNQQILHERICVLENIFVNIIESANKEGDLK